MNTRTAMISLLLVTVSFLMGGCSKTEETVGAGKNGSKEPSLQEALSGEGQKMATLAALPQADASVPVEKYVPLTSGNQLMFMYYGLSNMPVDYEKVASIYSRDYRATSDAFKKQDILKALTPRIDAEIAKAKELRYYQVEFDANLGSYDFNAKGFPVDNSIGPDSYGYFSDNRDYRYSFTNGDKYKLLKVEDEAKARQIEALVENYRRDYRRRMRLVYYAFAQDADPGNMQINSQIVRIKLVDDRGGELLIY